MSTHNICFHQEIRKILCGYPLLSVAMNFPLISFILQVVKALHYLHTELHVIHRDVKPSNILINRKGQVKICDFGISGHLVDSVAKTIEAGCKPYMAVGVPIFLLAFCRFDHSFR